MLGLLDRCQKFLPVHILLMVGASSPISHTTEKSLVSSFIAVLIPFARKDEVPKSRPRTEIHCR